MKNSQTEKTNLSPAATNGGYKVESYTYDVYGEPTIHDGSGAVIGSSVWWIDNPLFFTGRPRDPDTTLYNYRYRWYSPSLGRFVQVDPIRTEGGPNLYVYVHNNPANFVDVMGLVTCPKGQHPKLDKGGFVKCLVMAMPAPLIGCALIIVALVVSKNPECLEALPPCGMALTAAIAGCEEMNTSCVPDGPCDGGKGGGCKKKD